MSFEGNTRKTRADLPLDLSAKHELLITFINDRNFSQKMISSFSYDKASSIKIRNCIYYAGMAFSTPPNVVGRGLSLLSHMLQGFGFSEVCSFSSVPLLPQFRIMSDHYVPEENHFPMPHFLLSFKVSGEEGR